MQIKELLHPLDFRDGWGLKNQDAAELIGLTSLSLYRYSCVTDIKTKPTKPAMRAAALQSQVWLIEGKTPVQPELLADEQNVPFPSVLMAKHLSNSVSSK